MQLIFAGKAHPLDRPGKSVLQEVARLARDPSFVGKIVFIEDYDISVGRDLVQGVDVWLNNPRRPLEACGTSGQKVVLNGGLNLSVLDGWWAEAYDGLNGFAIGDGDTHTSTAVHDARDGRAAVDVLRDEVVPLYYDRDRDGLPREWIARMKRAHPDARLAFQRRTHGDGLRAEGLHPRRRRYEQRYEGVLTGSVPGSRFHVPGSCSSFSSGSGLIHGVPGLGITRTHQNRNPEPEPDLNTNPEP